MKYEKSDGTIELLQTSRGNPNEDANVMTHNAVKSWYRLSTPGWASQWSEIRSIIEAMTLAGAAETCAEFEKAIGK